VLEQEFVQGDDALFRGEALRHARAQAQRQALDLAEVALHLQRRVGVLRDHQAGLGKIDPPVFAGERPGEGFQPHAAARREKWRGRKPKAKRQPP
jgi:hypothetical protein